jgi:hypothetical protein
MRKHDDKDLELLWRSVTVWRYWRTLRKVVAARASQFWRVVSADRARAAALADAELKAKKRKTRKQKDAKALAAARQEGDAARAALYAGFPTLPRLRQLPWGKGLPLRLHALCATLLPHMDKELVRECGQRHLCYWRDGPRFFKAMRGMVELRKKSTVAWRFFARTVQLAVLQAWAVAARRSKAGRDARRRERAAARRVTKQRAQALAWAVAQGHAALQKQLEGEQADADKVAQLKGFARRERLQASGRSSTPHAAQEDDHSSDDDDEAGEIAEERAEEEARELAAGDVAAAARAAAAAAAAHARGKPAPSILLLLHDVGQTVGALSARTLVRLLREYILE